MADRSPRPLPSGLMPGDIDWLATLTTELLADGETRQTPQAQRILGMLKEHEHDFRLNSAEREQKLKDQWHAWEREAQNRHCIVCTEIMWTQDMSGKDNVLCMGCGRPMCLTHYMVHKAMEGDGPTPEQHQAAARELCLRIYGVPDWRNLSIAQRASLSTEILLPMRGRDTYTIYVNEYEQHWKHRCRTPIPHKDMKVLRIEQAIHQAELIRIDKEMEEAPAEVEP